MLHHLCSQVCRALLASCSDYFRALFEGDWRETARRRVHITDVPAEVMHALLQYCHSGGWDMVEAEEEDELLAELYVAADRFGMHRLKVGLPGFFDGII